MVAMCACNPPNFPPMMCNASVMVVRIWKLHSMHIFVPHLITLLGTNWQPCSSYGCHLTYGAVFGLSNRSFLTIWLEWSKSLNLITCSDGVNIFKISNVTALTARLLPIVKLRTRSRSRSGEGQECQIWTLAVLYFWFSPEHGRL